MVFAFKSTRPQRNSNDDKYFTFSLILKEMKALTFMDE